ncbi:MAG: hypothetical protein ACW977_06150 [Candidatus Thorarchaeota archaeon]|jgi:hypothetical protein
MKRIPVRLDNEGQNMDLNGAHLIIPATATKLIHLAGGAPMVQAVPEDYLLAATTLRAIEKRNGADLEFILKAYLPIVIIPSPIPGRSFLLESLGLTSEKVSIHSSLESESIIKAIGKSREPSQLIESIRKTQTTTRRFLEPESITILGLLSGALANSVSKLVAWPSRDTIEPHAVLIPPTIKDSDIRDTSKHLTENTLFLGAAEGNLAEIVVQVGNQAREILDGKENASHDVIARLDQRIGVLQKEVDDIESKLKQIRSRKHPDSKARLLEVQKRRDARLNALNRDLERRDKLSSVIKNASDEFMSGQNVLERLFENTRSHIRKQRNVIDQFLVHTETAEVNDRRTILLLPFILIGYAKKGQLRITISPPSYLKDDSEKVSLRRDFVDPIHGEFPGLQVLLEWLSKRANKDVGFRKEIRTLSGAGNLLTLKSSRRMIIDGAKLLLADGLIKESLLRDLDELLKGYSEQELKPGKISVDPRIATRDVAACQIKFHVHDETGAAIPEARLELGALVFDSDERGVIEVALPKSHYEGTVKAIGYVEKPIEFSLDTLADIVIPVVLSSLSREERLDQAVDRLVDRAKRIDQIRDRLAGAFENHGTTLLSIPAYRSVLDELLRELGFEPESWIAEAKKKRGMVKRLLKRDDRSDGIRRDILRLAEDSRQTGGIMLLSELLVRMDNLGWSTGSDEVENILEEMDKEGLVQGLSTLESGARLVKFIPVELTDDPQQILSLASKHEGKLTIEQTVIELMWTEERVMNALELLVANGVAKLQKSYARSTQYWFPGLKARKK